MFNEYALIAGIMAAKIPTVNVATNSIPSSFHKNSNGSNAILNSSCEDTDKKYNPILPKTIPRINPIVHRKILSNKTNHNSCNLVAPVILSNANSYLRSFNVLYNATKIRSEEHTSE